MVRSPELVSTKMNESWLRLRGTWTNSARTSCAAEFAAMDFGGRVVTDDADVVGTQAPALAGDEGRGHLASGHDACTEHFYFSAQGGELGKAENGIGGVLADAQDVESWRAHKVVVQGIERAGKMQAGCGATGASDNVRSRRGAS